jgi:hypothetical protein
MERQPVTNDFEADRYRLVHTLAVNNSFFNPQRMLH